MNTQQACALVTDTFPQSFDKGRFRQFAINLLNHMDEAKAQAWNSQYVKDAFKPHVARFERLGTYTSPEDEKLDVLIVHLTTESKLERARTAIRNFVADHLKQRNEKDAALVAFVSPTERQWRFSYVKMEYAAVEKDDGKVGVEMHLTPARRFSYIVGEGESCHTAQSRFLSLLQDTENYPTLAQIEDAFSVEAVTKEFFNQYASLFGDIEVALRKLAAKDPIIKKEFEAKNVSTVDFAKKLMGQIVFLYFLQKKGWLGVAKGQDWGTGPHDFLRRLARGERGPYENFFNDVLEPLFYDTLATDRGHEAWCNRFKCRIPFLNGGLFEPLADYDWRKTDIILPNKLFANSERNNTGDIGTGVLDVFDRYNFTVNEAEPLEKEVAIDPEMLGKVFENLIEENRRKGLGSYYTPREIVHYMCQESLINYLDTAINVRGETVGREKRKQAEVGDDKAEQTLLAAQTQSEVVLRADIETFVHLGDQISHYEAVETRYAIKMPKSIEQHARLIDDKLADITICDPAVGSGAFPVGMMTEIVRARSALTPYFNDVHDRTPYHFKRHAIQHCLYGVDIDPGAVEIAKLRLWLSLVVDEEDVKQIKPLPNLFYKIVTGNSLLGVEKNLFNQQLFRRLEELKPRYFDEADKNKKDRYKQQIEETIHELTNGKEAFDFEIYFSEVFHRDGGFNVVIANPPYGYHQIHSDSAKKYFKAHFAAARGSFEHFFLFYEASLKLIKIGGVQAFIAPVTWLTIPSAKALRRFVLSDYAISEICWLGEEVFEKASVNTLISVIQRRGADNTKVKFFELLSAFPRNPDCERAIPQKTFVEADYYISIFSATAENAVIDKIRKTSKLLADIAHPCSGYNPYEVGAGIAPEGGPHTEQTVKEKPYHSERQRGPQWKPEIIGRDLSRFHIHITGKRWIKYGPWLAAPRDPDNFTGERILVQEITGGKDKRIVAGYYDGELYHSRDVIPIKVIRQDPHPFYLLAVINSWLISWYHHRCNPKAQKGLFPKVLVSDLKKLPIYCASEVQQRPVVRLVQRILAAKQRDADTSALEREIDQLVYALYGLTPEEIKILEDRRTVDSK